MCEHCDECLTAGGSKLNGGFSRVAVPGLKVAALAMSRRARAFRRSHACASISVSIRCRVFAMRQRLKYPELDDDDDDDLEDTVRAHIVAELKRLETNNDSAAKTSNHSDDTGISGKIVESTQ
jgi:hypothetical protein